MNVLFFPSNRFGDFAQTLFQPDGAQSFVGDKLIAFVVTVLFAQFERIDLQCRGNNVHLRFDGPGGLGHSETAKGAGRRFIGVDGVGIDFEIGNPIGSGCRVTGFFCHPRPDLGIGAGVQVDLALARHQGAVFFNAGLHTDPAACWVMV